MYTVLIHRIRIIITDQMSIFIVLRKLHSMLASEFSTVNSSLTCHKNEKAQYKVAITQYLKTQTFYSVDEFFMPDY